MYLEMRWWQCLSVPYQWWDRWDGWGLTLQWGGTCTADIVNVGRTIDMSGIFPPGLMNLASFDGHYVRECFLLKSKQLPHRFRCISLKIVQFPSFRPRHVRHHFVRADCQSNCLLHILGACNQWWCFLQTCKVVSIYFTHQMAWDFPILGGILGDSNSIPFWQKLKYLRPMKK